MLNLILKSDVAGSVEAIEETLKDIPQEKVILRILSAYVGDVNESDVKLAKTSRAKILAFRVKTNPIALKLAERENVKIMNFNIIYELKQALCEFMERISAPRKIRIDLGKIKVLEIFRTDKKRQIVGGKVIEGEVKKGSLIEVFRPARNASRSDAGGGEENEKIGQGKMVGLQRNKKEIDEISKGQECGVLYEGDVKIEQGDILFIYIEERKRVKIDV